VGLSMDRANIADVRTRKPFEHSLCAGGRYVRHKPTRVSYASTCYVERDAHDLSVECKEKWTILDSIKVKAVGPTCEIKGARERPLVREQGTVDEVYCLAVFCGEEK
jgi:hypothetical protein